MGFNKKNLKKQDWKPSGQTPNPTALSMDSTTHDVVLVDLAILVIQLLPLLCTATSTQCLTQVSHISGIASILKSLLKLGLYFPSLTNSSLRNSVQGLQLYCNV